VSYEGGEGIRRADLSDRRQDGGVGARAKIGNDDCAAGTRDYRSDINGFIARYDRGASAQRRSDAGAVPSVTNKCSNDEHATSENERLVRNDVTIATDGARRKCLYRPSPDY